MRVIQKHKEPPCGLPTSVVAEIRKKQEEIQEGVRDVCRSRDHPVRASLFKNHLVDPTHKVVQCWLPKVACTSWKTVIAGMAAKVHQQSVHSPKYLKSLGFDILSPHAFQMKQHTNYSSYKSFLFVRHPLSRLLSAYRDKFERSTSSSKRYRKTLGRRIISRFRHNATERSLRTGADVSFDEFIKFIIQQGYKSTVPNRHWSPQHRLCDVCATQYTFIGKYEHFDRESKFVLNTYFDQCNMTMPSLNSIKEKPDIKAYYAKVSPHDMVRLFQLYRYDFKLFGYPESLPV